MDAQPQPSPLPISLPVEALSLPAPLDALTDMAAFPMTESAAYVFFYDPAKFSPYAFYSEIVEKQITIPFQLLFIPLIAGAAGPAVARARFDDIAEWVDAVRAEGA